MTSDDGELHNPMNLWSLDQRIEAMDADGIDVQLTSPTDVFYQYHQDPAVTATIASAVNDEVAEMVRARPTRIAGLATVPMQDTDLAVAELTRAIRDLGLRGVMIDDHVNGQTYDDPRFDAFWEAAAALGARSSCTSTRYLGRGAHRRFFFFNSIGNLVDRTITFGALPCTAGVMDRHPTSRCASGHAGGYTVFALDRMDRAGARSRQCGCDDRSAEHVRTPLHLRRGHLQPRTLRYLVDVVG
jgi:aminocarboxymuconate-semialdehyde decarboxylase